MIFIQILLFYLILLFYIFDFTLLIVIFMKDVNFANYLIGLLVVQI